MSLRATSEPRWLFKGRSPLATPATGPLSFHCNLPCQCHISRAGRGLAGPGLNQFIKISGESRLPFMRADVVLALEWAIDLAPSVSRGRCSGHGCLWGRAAGPRPGQLAGPAGSGPDRRLQHPTLPRPRPGQGGEGTARPRAQALSAGIHLWCPCLCPTAVHGHDGQETTGREVKFKSSVAAGE